MAVGGLLQAGHAVGGAVGGPELLADAGQAVERGQVVVAEALGAAAAHDGEGQPGGGDILELQGVLAGEIGREARPGAGVAALAEEPADGEVHVGRGPLHLVDVAVVVGELGDDDVGQQAGTAQPPGDRTDLRRAGGGQPLRPAVQGDKPRVPACAACQHGDVFPVGTLDRVCQFLDAPNLNGHIGAHALILAGDPYALRRRN